MTSPCPAAPGRDRCPATNRSCRSPRSAVFGSRGSSRPGRRSSHGWRLLPPPCLLKLPDVVVQDIEAHTVARDHYWHAQDFHVHEGAVLPCSPGHRVDGLGPSQLLGVAGGFGSKLLWPSDKVDNAPTDGLLGRVPEQSLGRRVPRVDGLPINVHETTATGLASTSAS